MIYLIKDEKCNGAFYKVGYATDLGKRLEGYYTANANIELLQTIDTYGKTKHQLETAVHREIKALGYKFRVTINPITKKRRVREWFFIPKALTEDFERKGLTQFKVCKGRMITEYRNNQFYRRFQVK
jgi:hypothetical protein